MIILALVGALLLATGCSTPANGPADLTKGKSAKQILEESLDKWYQAENYEIDLTSTIKMSASGETFDMSMSGKGIIFQKPLKTKIAMEMSIPGLDEKARIEQYMIEEDGKFVLYQYLDSQWQKMTFDDPALLEMAQMDPRDNLELFLDNLIQAEIVGEEKIGDSDTVIINLTASADLYDEVLATIGGEDFGVSAELMTQDILSKMGDLNYTIWVDKHTLDTVKCSIDLSENIRNLGNAMSETEDFPAEVKEAFASMEMAMEFRVLNINSAPDFTVPEEAKKAREMVLP